MHINLLVSRTATASLDNLAAKFHVSRSDVIRSLMAVALQHPNEVERKLLEVQGS